MNLKKTVFISVMLLAGCTTTVDPTASPYSQAAAIKGTGGTYKVGKPYKVLGQYYEPEENYSYSETGIASWYGKDFHAKKTANGEDYDMNTLTAAHRTLPLPSIVKVTNLENGRSLVLRVNDRGPFAKNRIIDISKRGSQLLGFQEKGTAKVRVDILEKESRELKAALLGEPVETTKTAYASSGAGIDESERRYLIGAGQNTMNGNIFVQAGAFTQKESAQGLSDQLQSVGKSQVASASVDGNKFYRVRLGPYTHMEEAQVALAKVKSFGVYNAKIIHD